MHENFVILNIDIAVDVHELHLWTFLEETGNFDSGFAFICGACNAGEQRKFQVPELIGKEVTR
jgi:hypothetical protein